MRGNLIDYSDEMVVLKKDISKEGIMTLDVNKTFHKKTSLYYINETKI